MMTRRLLLQQQWLWLLLPCVVIENVASFTTTRPHGRSMMLQKEMKIPNTILYNDNNNNNNNNNTNDDNKNRRSFVSKLISISASLPLFPIAAHAGIDMSALKALPVEGDDSGAISRLRQLEVEKVQPSDLIDIPYVELDSGVKYREYREGGSNNRSNNSNSNSNSNTIVVQPGSKVAVEMTIRCVSFATANEPGGLKYFTTKDDTEFNELAFTVGNGEMPPGLEEGMMGMKKNAIRRIEIPSMQTFAARKNNQLPLPNPKNKDGNRRFENLFKTDATLLFEVLLTRVK